MGRTIVVTCTLAVLGAACSSGGGGSASGAGAAPTPAASAATSGGARQPGRKGSSNVITGDELSTANVTNAFEAIQRLRPNWLRGRGATSGRQVQGNESINTMPTVYVDNSAYGELSQLTNISAATIREIQFLSATEATTRWGTNNTGGAILVLTKR